jgi:hypothetical protein
VRRANTDRESQLGRQPSTQRGPRVCSSETPEIGHRWRNFGPKGSCQCQRRFCVWTLTPHRHGKCLPVKLFHMVRRELREIAGEADIKNMNKTNGAALSYLTFPPNVRFLLLFSLVPSAMNCVSISVHAFRNKLSSR